MDEGTNRLQVNQYLQVQSIPCKARTPSLTCCSPQNQSCQVKGYKNIFALGDCCNTDEEKMGYFSILQGPKVVKNIIALRKAEATEKAPKLNACTSRFVRFPHLQHLLACSPRFALLPQTSHKRQPWQ